ncbi:hypothetical protein C7E18_23125, partial [Stenotrophomonas maltophilia]
KGEHFLPAPRWRRDAVAMPSTHDLPPLSGWLHGRDLRWRARLGIEVLPFARKGEHFLPAPRWRRDAVAMPSTHDLPPLSGWLHG